MMSFSRSSFWQRGLALGALSLSIAQGCAPHHTSHRNDGGGAGSNLSGGGTQPVTGGQSNGAGASGGSSPSSAGPTAAGASGALAAGGAGGGGSGSGGAGPDEAGGAGAMTEGGAGGDGNAVSYLGCHFVGGIDRLVISKRDDVADRCLSLILEDGSSMPSTDLVLPERWSLEAISVGPAEECPTRNGTRVQAGASGSVSLLDPGTGTAGQPTHVAADVTLTFSAPVPAGLQATEQLRVDSVDVRAPCNASCLPGRNQDCNDNPLLSSIHGRCTAAGTCVCDEGYTINPATGRCL